MSVRQVLTWQDAVGHHGDRCEDRQHTEEAEHRCASDVLATPCEPGVHAGALDSEEDESRDQHRVRDLIEYGLHRSRLTAPEVRRERLGIERETDNEDENHNGDELGDRDDPVDGRCLADSRAIR